MGSSAEEMAGLFEALIGGNDREATVAHYLSTGYCELDHALSSKWDGGFAGGRIVEISGPPSSGKTALATWAMAAAQRQGGIAGFNDHERSFSMKLAPNLGLNVEPGRFIYKKPETFEESIGICTQVAELIRTKKLIKPDAPIAWVFDSLAWMVPQSVIYDSKGKRKDPKDRNMNDNSALARATSAHMPRFSQLCEDLNVCAIFLNQIRTKIGVVYGDPRTTPGGDSAKFACSQRIMLSASKVVKNGEVIGSEITAGVIKNKVSRPFLTAKWRFMFQPDGSGKFDVVRSTIDFLDRSKRFEKAGNYIVWNGSKYYADALATKIEAENALPELLKLLPSSYDPEADAAIAAMGAEDPMTAVAAE